uniref:Very long-chain specific acyl-CoA dehydrogenase, mitochondrial n=1 Tax=Steinernema glaseri TaxID=37863 RepID=A0A1I7YGC3_9BILA
MARLAEVVGSHDLGLGVVMGAHQSIGYKGILLYGNDEQKQKYLPDLATGRKFASFCLTEPSSGSDANSIRSRAELSSDGKHYVLNGSKIWISNGGFADVFTVFAQTPVEQPDGTMKDKVSAFVVERGYGGVTSGPPEKKMGIKGSNTAEVYFENVKIPVENMLGEKGEGFKVAMNILNNGRFGIPAACTGSMKHCIQKTIEHITTRTQFGKKLQEFGNVQEQLTDMVLRHYEYQLEAAIGKVLGSENAWIVCDNAIQLHGGMGFMKECGLERVLRDLRIFRIFEGANDVMRLFIGLTGMQHAGKHLQHTVKQVSSGNVSALFGEVMRRASRSTGGDFSSVVHPSLQSTTSLVDAAIAHFGKTVEGLLTKHRKDIIDRQYEVIRVANAAIDIYSMIAVLSRCTRTLNSAGGDPNHEKQIAELYIRQASRRAIEQLKQADGANIDDLPFITNIAKDVCKNQALPQTHPIDV